MQNFDLFGIEFFISFQIKKIVKKKSIELNFCEILDFNLRVILRVALTVP